MPVVPLYPLAAPSRGDHLPSVERRLTTALLLFSILGLLSSGCSDSGSPTGPNTLPEVSFFLGVTSFPAGVWSASLLLDGEVIATENWHHVGGGCAAGCAINVVATGVEPGRHQLAYRVDDLSRRTSDLFSLGTVLIFNEFGGVERQIDLPAQRRTLAEGDRIVYTINL